MGRARADKDVVRLEYSISRRAITRARRATIMLQSLHALLLKLMIVIGPVGSAQNDSVDGSRRSASVDGRPASLSNLSTSFVTYRTNTGCNEEERRDIVSLVMEGYSS
jgi:hypothetical protein